MSLSVHSQVDTIIEARSERISALLEMCYKLLDQYESSTLVAPGDTSICTCGQSSKECDTLVYGCLIKGLRSLKLFPERAKVNEVELSVVAFADKLRSLECFAYPVVLQNDPYGYRYGRHPMGQGSHSSCGFTLAFANHIKVIIGQEEPSGVLEAHLTHLHEQKK